MVDTIGRILASGLSETLGQQVIVENAGGAGGMTGANRLAKAAPDGYVFLLGGSAALAFIPTLYKKPLDDAVTDFALVALVADSARVLITRKDLSPNTLAKFIAYAKANQGKMQYGSARRRLGDARVRHPARFGQGHQHHARPLSRRLLVDLLLSPEGQALIRDRGRVPARSDVARGQASIPLKLHYVNPQLAREADRHEKEFFVVPDFPADDGQHRSLPPMIGTAFLRTSVVGRGPQWCRALASRSSRGRSEESWTRKKMA